MKKRSSHFKMSDKAVRMRMGQLQDSDPSSSFFEGEEFVCRVCSKPVRPCEKDAHYQCKDKILGGTVLQDLVERVHEVSNGRPAACLICGRTLTPREMGKNALRDVCPACQAKSERKNAG